MMTKTKKITFIEAPSATLETVLIQLINDTPAATSRPRQTSLIELGQVNPVRLRPTSDGRFEIVDGRRRIADAKVAGIETVTALVESLSDDQATLYSLVQMSRSPNPMMEAKEIAKLLRTRTQQQVAKSLGITQAVVSQRVGLLDLIPELQDRLEVGEMTLTAARSAKKLSAEAQATLAKEEKVTVKVTEDLLRNYQAEMVDLSSIDIPSLNPLPPSHVVLSEEDVAKLVAGGQVSVELDGQELIITRL